MSEPAEPAVPPHLQPRREDRGRHDRATIHAILDEALVAHVGFVDDGRPVVIPMLHARIDDDLYLHGSPASRLLRLAKRGLQVCVEVTILDGLVLARSAFNHSANYRSVVMFGEVEAIAGLDERRRVLDAYTDKVVPGRRPHLRPMTDKEVRGTAVLRLGIVEASAKVRSGPPVDSDDDYALPIWAGVLDAARGYYRAVPDDRNPAGLAVPEHVTEMMR